MRVFLLIFFLINIGGFEVNGQELSFNNTTLNTIFVEIESRTDYRFNFDMQMVSKYTFTGIVNFDNIENATTTILKKTPFSFEINNSLILILLPQKQYTLCGYIKNAFDSSVVSLANIYLDNLTSGVTTDDKGYFSLTVKAKNTQYIIISHLEFENEEILIKDWPKSNCLTIKLKATSNELDGVEINYILPGITEGKDYGSINIDTKQLTKNHQIQEVDVLKIVQQLPGISSADESASNLNIRGSTPDQNLIVWEGVALYNSSHVLGMVSSINPFLVDNINIYRSVYHPIYDNRVGGVVDIALSDKVENKFTGGLGTTLADSHAYLNIPVVKDKLSITTSGRYVTNTLFNSPIIKNYSEKIFASQVSGEEVTNTTVGFKGGDDQLEYSDFNAKIIYQPSDKIQFDASYFNSSDNTSFISNITASDLQSNETIVQDTEAFRGQFHVAWNKKNTSKIFYTQSKYKGSNHAQLSNISENGFSTNNSSSNDVSDINFGITNTLSLNKNLEIDLGYVSKWINIDYTIDQPSNVSDESEGTSINKANLQNFIGSINFKNKSFSLKTGFRQTYYNTFNKWFFSPRINAQYLINNKFKLKFSAGVFNQFINKIETFGEQQLNTRTNFWILSKSETGKHLKTNKMSGGFTYKPSKWLFDVEAYYNNSSGISSLSGVLNSSDLIEGNGKSRVIGIDFLMKKNWNNYNFWLNYTLSKNTFESSSSTFTKFPSNNDQRHNLSVYNTYKRGKWNFSISYNYKSGLPFSTPVGVEQVTSENNITTNRLNYELLNDQKLDDYNRFDLGVSYKTKLSKNHINLEIGVSVLNLLNTTNSYSKNFFLVEGEEMGTTQINSIENYHLKRTPQVLLRIYW